MHPGIEHFFKAFGWSLAGLKAAWRNEMAFRQECIAGIVLIPSAIWLGETGVERAVLLASLLLVLSLELVNSAIEAAVDRCSEEHHPLAGRAKDLGSAAVFVSLVATVAIWGLILCPHYF
ncbi:MAG: diacylglycerol kinase [Magnetococcales bacterium]|nr:diacylglycerol kinase [Magnetococcales bacterium]